MNVTIDGVEYVRRDSIPTAITVDGVEYIKASDRIVRKLRDRDGDVRKLRDRDGDVWKLMDNGNWTISGRTDAPGGETLGFITDNYGPLTEV